MQTSSPLPLSSSISPAADSDISVLDQPAWSSLSGAHAHFAEGDDFARRYNDEVSPFVGVVSWNEPRVWPSLIELFGSAAEVSLSHMSGNLPEGWTEVSRGSGLQLVASDDVTGERFDEAIELGAADVDDMLDLIARNQPGPFRQRTHELGRYVGVRRGGRLIAMAGTRLQPAGYTEISAVCVDSDFRRQGLASALTLDVAHAIRQRGDTPFLHASATNLAAIAAYEKIGFSIRTEVTFLHARTPA